MKKLSVLIASVLLGAIMLFCGCASDGRDGRDGKDGQDVTIQSIYEEAKKIPGNENLTFDEFLKEYLSYDDTTLDVQAAINKSLMSGVAILTRFAYTSSWSSGLGITRYTYKVYTGSGAILWLDKEAGDAYVVTNCHVVYDDTSVSTFCQDVRLYLYGQDESGVNYVVDENGNISGDDNYRIKAEIIGASVTYDIALLKVSGSEVLKRSDAVVSEFSTEEDVYVGEKVYAVGNASGEGISASEGIISRDSEYIVLSLSEKANLYEDDYVQYRVMRITAPINHGNSGGALYNSKGEIIAIVNAKDEGEDIDNMGYALPANSVRRLLGLMYDNYVSNGYKMSSGGGVDKALLNVTTTVTDSYAIYNESAGRAEIHENVRVYEVSGNPASGKLKAGDYLKAVEVVGSDGTVKEKLEVTRDYHVREVMFSVRLGDTVKLKVERSGEEIEVTINFDKSTYFYHYD